MTRRHIFAAIAAADASRALGGFAHPPTRVFRIGFLGAESATAAPPGPGVLVTRLRELGYAQGQNLVNLKPAAALGITIPDSLLLRADDVIR